MTTLHKVADDPGAAGAEPEPDDELRAYEARERAERLRSWGINFALYAIAIVVALGLSALLVLFATDASPWSVFRAMYDGSLSTGGDIGKSIDESTPILVVALGVLIASRAAITNIGPEGQLMVGATVATWTALHAPGPGPLVIVLVILSGALGGAIWASIAAVLRYWRHVDVVISTLLLNFVAVEVVALAVNRGYLLQESTETNRQSLPQSPQVPHDTRLPRLGHYPDFNVSTAVFIALVLLAIVWVALQKTRWGVRLRVLGMNPVTARRVGISVAAFGGGALLLSGAFAGAAGGLMLTGTVFRLQGGFSQNVGYEGLLVALIARGKPGWLVPVAFFFGALETGGAFLNATGVPRYLVDIVQSLLVLATLFPPVFLLLVRKRRELTRAALLARADTDPILAVTP